MTISITSVVNRICDVIDQEAASIHTDLRDMDSQSTGAADNAKGIYSATFGGLSASVMSMVSGTLRIAPALFSHPIDTTKKIVTALPAGIKQMGADAKRGINLMREGRYAEGTFVLSKSGTDIAAAFTGAAGVAKGATAVLEKGAQIAFREITATADAVNMGSGGGLATSSGVFMAANAEVAVQTATASISGSGLMCGPLMMSATQPQSDAPAPQQKVQSREAYVAKFKELDASITSLESELETLRSNQISWIDRNITKSTASRIKALDKKLSGLREEREVLIGANQEWVIKDEFSRASVSGQVNLKLLRVETAEQFEKVLFEFDSAETSLRRRGGWSGYQREISLSKHRRAFIAAHPEMASASVRLAFERISWPTRGPLDGGKFEPWLVPADKGKNVLMVDTHFYQAPELLGNPALERVGAALKDTPMLTPVRLADDLWVVLFEKRPFIGELGNHELWAVLRSEAEAVEFAASRATH